MNMSSGGEGISEGDRFTSKTFYSTKIVTDRNVYRTYFYVFVKDFLIWTVISSHYRGCRRSSAGFARQVRLARKAAASPNLTCVPDWCGTGIMDPLPKAGQTRLCRRPPLAKPMR
jgi:hypothetical protein